MKIAVSIDEAFSYHKIVLELVSQKINNKKIN